MKYLNRSVLTLSKRTSVHHNAHIFCLANIFRACFEETYHGLSLQCFTQHTSYA
jgi:hypothetical protein